MIIRQIVARWLYHRGLGWFRLKVLILSLINYHSDILQKIIHQGPLIYKILVLIRHPPQFTTQPE